MTNQNPIFYSNLNQLAAFNSDGELINPGLNGAVDGISEGLSRTLEERVFGGNKVFKILFSGDVLSTIITMTLRFNYGEDGEITGVDVLNGEAVLGQIASNIVNELPSLIGTYGITEVLIGGAASVFGGGTLGAVIGSIAVAGGVSIAYSYLEGFTTSTIENLVNNNLGLSQIDLQFTDSSGVHNSGLFFSDGMGGLTEKGAIAYFLGNSGLSESEIVNGKFNFSISGGVDHEYQIHDGSIYSQIASNLGVSLNQFLSFGLSGKTNSDNYIAGFDKFIIQQAKPTVGLVNNDFSYIEARNCNIENVIDYQEKYSQ